MKKIKQKIEVNKPAPSPAKMVSYSNSWHQWLVAGVAIILYANTISHQYTQDDAIVIYENIYTKAGISGWGDIFSKDTFAGFFKDDSKLNLVSGGRYRPFTLAMFAVEYQLFGNKPWFGHLVNILLFAFLSLLIYKLLVLLFSKGPDIQSSNYLAFAIALLFAVHPIHTEVVANIKGRDEIMAMLGAVLSVYYMVKYMDTQKKYFLVVSLIALFIGLLSKENAITFLMISPLVLYFFRNYSLKNAIFKSSFIWIPTILFLLIRTAVVGNNFGNQQPELMNNPFLKMVNGEYIPFSIGEKLATIIYTLGKYIQLLIFPHPLTHDYYPRHIDIMHFTDIAVILSTMIYFGLFYLAYKGLKIKSLVSFGIIYFLITLSIVSNLIFPIGTNMSERFVFMPSLGFAIVLGFVLHKYLYLKSSKVLYYSCLSVLTLLFSAKTFTRNLVWESDYKLFTTDVKTSTKSAKVLNAAAGSLSERSLKEENIDKKQEMLEQALNYINQAIEIHPLYKNAYFIKGNILNYLNDFDNSILAYKKTLELDPNFIDAQKNYAVTLRLAGKYAGEKENNLIKAEQLLSESDKLQPNDPETLRLLGVINGVKGNHQLAVHYFEKAVAIDSQNASAYYNLGMAYRSLGNAQLADKYLQRSKELDPKFK